MGSLYLYLFLSVIIIVISIITNNCYGICLLITMLSLKSESLSQHSMQILISKITLDECFWDDVWGTLICYTAFGFQIFVYGNLYNFHMSVLQ